MTHGVIARRNWASGKGKEKEGHLDNVNKSLKHCNKAIQFDERRMFLKAEKEYLTALKYNPDNPYVLYGLGTHYRGRGDNRRAYLYHKKFLVVFDAIEEMLTAMDYDINEVDDIETAVNLWIAQEDRATMLACAANTLDHMDDPDAQRFLEMAVRLSPASECVRFNMGAYYLKRGFFEDALKEFQKAHKINPDDPDTVVNIGHCLCYMNLREEEVRIYEEYLKDHQPTVDILIHLSFGYLDLDRYDDSVISFREYASFLPDSAEAHAGLALVYAHKGWKNESYKEIEVAQQLNATARDKWVEDLIRDALEILEDPDNNYTTLLFLLLLMVRRKAHRINYGR